MAERRHDEDDVLVVRKVLRASAEFLYDAWTVPTLMARWFHSTSTWTTEVVRADVRVGGRWELLMREGDATRCRVFGKYLALERPTRVVFTWHPDEREDYETTVTVTFRAIDRDTTELVLAHAGLRDAPDRERHGRGWDGCLASLGDLIGAREENQRRT